MRQDGSAEFISDSVMLTTSVATASMSDSFSYKLMHITSTKGANRHSPVAGFIIAHGFVIIKYKGAVAGS